MCFKRSFSGEALGLRRLGRSAALDPGNRTDRCGGAGRAENFRDRAEAAALRCGGRGLVFGRHGREEALLVTRFTPTRACATLALLLGVSAVLPNRAQAQFPDLVDLSAQYMPPVALEDPRPTRAQVSSYDGSLNIPIILGDKSFLIPGVAYHVESISYASAPPDFAQLRAFHSVDIPFLYVQLLPGDWSFSVRLAPGLAGDFEAVDRDMVRLSALLLFTKGFSESLVVGGGALASYSFGTLLPLPAAYIDWQPAPDWQLEAFLPAFLDLTRSFHARFELGGRVEIWGNAYAVRDARIPPGRRGNVAYSIATAGVTAGVRLFADVWMTWFAGRSIFRRFDQMNHAGKLVDGGRQRMADGFFVRGALTWRLPHD